MKSLTKKAKKGFRGYPVATVALYGPTDKKATKLVNLPAQRISEIVAGRRSISADTYYDSDAIA